MVLNYRGFFVFMLIVTGVHFEFMLPLLVIRLSDSLKCIRTWARSSMKPFPNISFRPSTFQSLLNFCHPQLWSESLLVNCQLVQRCSLSESMNIIVVSFWFKLQKIAIIAINSWVCIREPFVGSVQH